MAIKSLALTFIAVCFSASLASAAQPYGIEWAKWTEMAKATGVASDRTGNLMVIGNFCRTCTERDDAFLSKFDSSGTELWRQRLGSSGGNESFGLAVDQNGDSYVTGYTTGNLDGQNLGGTDAFLSKIDNQGNLLWTNQFGSDRDEQGNAVAVDLFGNAYTAGHVHSALGNYESILTKFDADGNHSWTRTLTREPFEIAHSIAVDSLSNVYLGGRSSTGGFLTKFDDEGNSLWNFRVGTDSNTNVQSLVVDDNDQVYAAGITDDASIAPWERTADAFLIKLDGLGNRLWTAKVATPYSESSDAVALDLFGNVYVAGTINDDPRQYSEFVDMTLSKYDSDGKAIWTQRVESPMLDIPLSVAADPEGNLYLAGYTESRLLVTVPRNEFPVSFLMRFSTNVPEPSSILLLVVAAGCGFLPPMRLRMSRRIG